MYIVVTNTAEPTQTLIITDKPHLQQRTRITTEIKKSAGKPLAEY